MRNSLQVQAEPGGLAVLGAALLVFAMACSSPTSGGEPRPPGDGKADDSKLPAADAGPNKDADGATDAGGQDAAEDGGAAVECEINENAARSARQLLLDEGRFRAGDEIPGIYEIGVADAVAHEGECLYRMEFCSPGSGPESCGSPTEVVAIRAGQALLFEDAFGLDPVDHTITIKVELLSGYYAELTGESAIFAEKAIAVGYRQNQGFVGVVLNDGKASFDPTPGRTWRVVQASYDLRDTLRNEVDDIHAYQIENNYDTFYSGARKVTTPEGEGFFVGPWAGSGSVFTMRVDVNGETDLDEVAEYCATVSAPQSFALTPAERASCEAQSEWTIRPFAFDNYAGGAGDVFTECPYVWCQRRQ